MPSVIQSDVLRTGVSGVVLPANTWVSIDAGYDLTRFHSKLLIVKNVGANLIGDGAVQGTTVAPAKRVETDWLDVDPMVFANLAAGATKTWEVPEPGKWPGGLGDGTQGRNRVLTGSPRIRVSYDNDVALACAVTERGPGDPDNERGAARKYNAPASLEHK
jgi:hypothetical protein